MRRILIVDDEKPVAFGIQHILERDFSSDYAVAGAAFSGREAVEKASSLAPDIVLMDVRMPGFSGLEALRELRKRGSRAAFIMVTAYERFEIAREAMELGVVDYLLKPISTEALSASLAVASRYLDDKQEVDKAKLELHELDEKLRFVSEAALLRAAAAGPVPAGEMEMYRGSLGIRAGHAFVCVFGIGLDGESPQACGGAASDSECMEKILASIRYKTAFLAGSFEDLFGIVLIPLKEDAEAQEAAGTIRSLIWDAAKASGRGQTFARLGFGQPHAMEDAHSSWNEAVLDYLAVRRGQGTEVLAETETSINAEGQNLAALYEFRRALLENRVVQARLLAGRILEEEKSRFSTSGLDASTPIFERAASEVFLLLAIFGELLMRFRDSGGLEPEQESRIEAFKALLTSTSREEFSMSVGAWMELTIDFVEKTMKRHSNLVSAAMAYVAANFSRPINLEKAAEEVGISANRLSRLFVEETGNGFSRYLVSFRMAKAKDMLARKGSSVKEVSVACGYPDQNYFARLFKKLTGISPSAYTVNTPEVDDGK